MNHPKSIYTVNAFAGSGKTYRALRWSLTEAMIHQRKTVMVFKSTKLIDQAHAVNGGAILGHGSGDVVLSRAA